MTNIWKNRNIKTIGKRSEMNEFDKYRKPNQKAAIPKRITRACDCTALLKER